MIHKKKTHITCITHITYIIHIFKVNFEAYKKLIKIFFIIFFSIYKNGKIFYQRHEEKLGKEAREGYQNLCKKGKDGKKAQGRDQNLFEEEKENIIVNVIRMFLKKKRRESWVCEKLLFST